MRFVLLALWLASCAGAPKPDPDPVPVEPQRTELEVRQDAACNLVGGRVIDCAMTDLQASTPPEELAKLDLAKMREENVSKFMATCAGGAMSSRQVRVYEVCAAAETECEPLLACLDNARPQ
jgi:hypothetical protein